MYVSRADIGALPPGIDCYQSLGGLSGLGAAPEDLLKGLKENYFALREQIIAANDETGALSEEQLNSNLGTLDRTYTKVMRGEYDRAPMLVQAARGILAGVGRVEPDSTLEDILNSIIAIPQQLAAAVVATGQTAGDALRAAGIDPEKVTEGVTDTLRYLGIAAGGTVALVVLHKLGVFSRGRKNPRGRR